MTTQTLVLVSVEYDIKGNLLLRDRHGNHVRIEKADVDLVRETLRAAPPFGRILESK